jgi:hypothetical protein
MLPGMAKKAVVMTAAHSPDRWPSGRQTALSASGRKARRAEFILE